MLTPLVLGLALVGTPAHAGRCDYLLRKADTTSGMALADAFAELTACDHQMAEDHYTRFMTGATDSDALVALSMVAIDNEVWNPVWQQLTKISSYDARDEIALEIGQKCAADPKVVSFLQGAYFGLRDIEFQQWDDAFIACDDPTLMGWMTEQIENPPNRMFDEKYNALMAIFVEKRRGEALPHLAKGAIKAAEAGPYDAILMQINAAVQPGLGETMSDADKRALESALVAVAQGVDPQKATAVANQLANAGFQEAAARLLPRVYPDRVQSGNTFLYGGASIEAGECKGTKMAVIHYAEIVEPGKRWGILGAVEKPLRSVKPRLVKCTLTWEDWPVATTPEPLANAKALSAWVEELAVQWIEQGYTVDTRGEKAITLD